MLGYMQMQGGVGYDITSNGYKVASPADDISRKLALDLAGTRNAAPQDSLAQRDKVQDAWANFGKPNGAEFLTSLSASGVEKDRIAAGSPKGALEDLGKVAEAASIASNSKADFINKSKERDRALNEAKFEYEKTQTDKATTTDENRYRDAQYEKQVASVNAASQNNAALGRSQFQGGSGSDSGSGGGVRVSAGAALEMIKEVSRQPDATERANAAQLTQDDVDRQQMQFDRRKQIQMQDEDRAYAKATSESDRTLARAQMAIQQTQQQQGFGQAQGQSRTAFDVDMDGKRTKNRLDKGIVNPTIDSIRISNQGARSQQAMQKEDFNQRMRRSR